MEITKERNGSVADSKGHRPLFDVTINDCAFAQGLEESEADEIINEHDTLKAKAGLLNKMFDLLLRAITIEKSADCEYCMENSQCPFGSVDECIREKGIALLKIAKALK
jgi:hypothetical protein